jgi:hypothetical protein
LLGSISWPFGSQIFSVEWLPRYFAKGLPFTAGRNTMNHREELLFYSFKVPDSQED